jgi:NitT/TauT family transport system substrate-binding protein
MKIWTASNTAKAKGPALVILSALVIMVLVLSACGPTSPASAPVAGKPVEIKIALLPIIDALPMFVAAKQGYFAANGVNVSFTPVASAAERDQLMAAGQADGMINDLISLALYNKQSVQIQTVRFARTASKDTAMYRILVAKNSSLKTPADLAGVEIGISQGTIIDYVTTRLLEKEGLTADQIKSIAVPKMNDRMTLLESGELKAATLPEPFSTMAQKSGAVLLLDDSKYPEYGTSVISFRKAFIDQNPQAVKGFLKAIEQAVIDINKDPNSWRSLLAENKLIPAAVQDTYPVPSFQAAAVPSKAQFQDVVDWEKSRKLLDKDLDYGASVTDQFLPK